MNAIDRQAASALPAQQVSLDVLQEKYAKGEERDIVDVRARGGR